MGDMKKVLIQRIADESGDHGTFGKLSVQDGTFECYSAELPFRDVDGDGKRDANMSCIAPGTYTARWTQSPNRKDKDGNREWSFRLYGVPDAEGVLIHAGNFVGDITKGYLADAQGCICLGRAIMDIEIPEYKRTAHPEIGERTKQKGVTSSKDALAAFIAYIGKDPFELTIKE